MKREVDPLEVAYQKIKAAYPLTGTYTHYRPTGLGWDNAWKRFAEFEEQEERVISDHSYFLQSDRHNGVFKSDCRVLDLPWFIKVTEVGLRAAAVSQLEKDIVKLAAEAQSLAKEKPRISKDTYLGQFKRNPKFTEILTMEAPCGCRLWPKWQNLIARFCEFHWTWAKREPSAGSFYHLVRGERLTAAPINAEHETRFYARYAQHMSLANFHNWYEQAEYIRGFRHGALLEMDEWYLNEDMWVRECINLYMVAR